jgi:hypothetical protein
MGCSALVVRPWTGLGEAYFLMNDLANAEKCFEQRIKIRDQSGSPNLQLQVLLVRLINTKDKLGKAEEVADLNRRLLKQTGLQWRRVDGQMKIPFVFEVLPRQTESQHQSSDTSL